MTQSDDKTRTNALVIIAGVAVLATIYEAHWFFVPVAFGLTLAAVLYPIVHLLRRAHLPAALAAAVAVIAAAALIFGIGAALEPTLRDLGTQVPKTVAAARAKLTAMGGPFTRLATLGVTPPLPAAPASPGATPTGTPAASPPGGTQSMAIVQRVFGGASSLISELVEVTLLALFLLAAGDSWREKLAIAVHDPARQTRIADGFAEMRSVVGRYFVVTLFINLGQAIIIAVGLMLLGYPSPVLWGTLTFLLEFIPYLGGLLLAALLLLVGLASGGSLLHAIAGPALYLAVTTIQNNLISPIAYGRGLSLNPTAILVGLVLFWGLWGVAGAFLAVPILAAAAVVARRNESLRGFAAFVGD